MIWSPPHLFTSPFSSDLLFQPFLVGISDVLGTFPVRGNTIDFDGPRRGRGKGEGPACFGTLTQGPVWFRKGGQGC